MTRRASKLNNCCGAPAGIDAKRMHAGEALRFSVQALQANKFRTFLTALGLIIGNASVILVVTISISSRDYILDQIRGIGSNLIYANTVPAPIAQPRWTPIL